MGTESTNDLRVDVAVLKTNYDHLEEKVGEIAGRMTTMDGKIDRIVLAVTEEKAKRTIMQRMVGAWGHVVTGGVTLAIAKFLHVPINLG